eukprot:TRINITY_DN5447_c0_g1_i1.p1 TRINITY_DN5447_c0_g1~~TRINITY_DN5447_c0_g1_i1.p1  ORF type:complete len:820 (-),score=235.45 TRINITY_DN5447_c0_g1_i1:84-2522(-)
MKPGPWKEASGAAAAAAAAPTASPPGTAGNKKQRTGKAQLPALNTNRRPVSADSKDISHLHDKINGKIPIPATMIPEQYHVKEVVLSPSPGAEFRIEFDDKDKVWKKTVFPSLKPASRREVLLLDEWLTETLEENQKKNLGPIDMVKEAQQLYSICIHEVIRQVYVQCMERGQLLEKIWKRYLQLFEHVLKIREREQNAYNQKLQQQKLMYQQLYKDKDEMFNKVYLQLAADKERVQMSKDKLERVVLLLQEEFKHRIKLEERMRKVIETLKVRAKQVSGFDDSREESSFAEEESLLPADVTPDCFSANNLIMIQKLTFIQEKLSIVKEEMPKEAWDHNYGSLLQLDNLLTSLSETISRLSQIETSAQTASASVGPAANKFQIDKSTQYSLSDTVPYVPSSFQHLFAKSLKVPTITVHKREWALTFVNCIYVQKIISDEEYDAKNAPRLEMPEFVYQFFVNLYGLRHLAELKLLDFLETVRETQSQSLRLKMFASFCGFGDKYYSPQDLSFFLYTMAQFFEGVDSELVFQESADGYQWITLDVARVIVDLLFREQDPDSKEGITAACEGAVLSPTPSSGEGRLDLDAFLEIVVSKCHELSKQLEDQLVSFYNTAVVTDVITPDGYLLYDEYLGLMKAFNPTILDSQIMVMYRELQQNTELYSVTLDTIIKVARKSNLMSWKTLPPTSVDRKRCNQPLSNLIAYVWEEVGPEVQQEIRVLSTQPKPPRSLQMLVERFEDLVRYLESRDNTKSLVAAFRLFSEQLFFTQRKDAKVVQGHVAGLQLANKSSTPIYVDLSRVRSADGGASMTHLQL